jgi:hypothetical protein
MPNPTARQIDAHAKELIELQAIAEEAAEAVKAKKDALLPVISEFGFSPDKAPKTKRLEGEEFYLDATFGQSTSVVKKNVDKFAEQLGQDGDQGFFPAFFITENSYIVSPEANTYLGNISQKARNLFAKCLRTVQQKPKVNAESKSAVKGAKAQKAS